MKKTVLTSLALLFAINISNAQISAPIQSDTLHITSMQYNFNDISKANWPFTYIIQTTTSFIVDDKEFSILEANDKTYREINYTLSDGEHEYNLVKENDNGDIVIKFSNYILCCSKKKNSDSGQTSFNHVAIQPTFNGGGPNEFTLWVNKRLRSAYKLTGNSLGGRVLLQFVIDTDGSLTDVKVISSSHPSLSEEAIRVVSSSPKWKPGKDSRGNVIKVSYTFPVNFQF